MAIHLQTLKTRSLTAIVFVAVMLSGILLGFWPFVVLFTVVHFGCWYEFIKLLKQVYQKKYIGYALLGVLYITLPILLLLDFRRTGEGYQSGCWNDGLLLPVVVIGAMWVNDTMAYIVGSLIGKTPFSKVSPKKTWEGTIGGSILCVIVMGFIATAINSANFPVQGYHWFVLVAIAAIFGTIGDLIESKLKRMANVKDSGTLMPGHGGFLDRFDSLLVAIPFVWLYVKLFI